jgi:hypothetical protein
MSSEESQIQGRQSGQAAVESALTLPLVIFLILGTLQLFMMLQARIMAQYAVFRATRAGAISNGDCDRMLHAAVGALLPTFTRTDSPELLGEAFEQFGKKNRYNKDEGVGDGSGKKKVFRGGSAGDKFTGDVVWILRESPTGVTEADQDTFDQGGEPQRLEVKMVFWYPLRMPFVDWVMTKMFRARYALEEYHAANPLMLTVNDANWKGESVDLDALIRTGYSERTGPGTRAYVFPIVATYSMRMMTPPLMKHFGSQHCAPKSEEETP